MNVAGVAIRLSWSVLPSTGRVRADPEVARIFRWIFRWIFRARHVGGSPSNRIAENLSGDVATFPIHSVDFGIFNEWRHLVTKCSKFVNELSELMRLVT